MERDFILYKFLEVVNFNIVFFFNKLFEILLFFIKRNFLYRFVLLLKEIFVYFDNIFYIINIVVKFF